jgi:hypothetical protein
VTPGTFAQVIADQFILVDRFRLCRGEEFGYRAWARRLRAEAIYPVWA